MTRLTAALVYAAVLAHAGVARGQSDTTVRPLSDFEVLIGVHNALHVADMLTTSYALSIGPTAVEKNPFLKPFADNPAALAAVSGAFSAAEVWALTKLRAKRPKTAVAITLALVATELWAVTNNVKVLGQIQAARSGWRPPFQP